DLEPDCPRGLDEHAVARLHDLVRGLDRSRCVRNPARDGNAGRAVEVAAGQVTDRDERLDADPPRLLADLAVELRSPRAELRHVAKDGDPAARARPLREVDQGRTHGDGVRVVRVVDQQAAAGKLELFAAPAREVDVDTGGPRQAE